MTIEEKIKRFGKRSDSIGGFRSKPLIELPYGLVRVELPRIEDANDQVVAVMKSQHPAFDIEKFSGNEITYFLLWLNDEVEKIAELEERFLSSDPEPAMLAAGVQRLNEFGAYATVDSLAGGDILKHEAIMQLPYYAVYQKLKLDKVNREIEKDYHNIIAGKAKR
ncbi:hypothetical protein SAMN05443429_11237 [Cruoricaptor ignavus]|uniref:Uncharacterized protein n=1 Tax=Cruoricaptor ignavus TaxID=1118202 RepID=A0A1M6HEJ6_9FLAO|nr:hypothetical protein [Cruoricaptor ignavus]SHJ20622.1 hypothetical protein SAMN05443429_11237 [Cruoricaptor ignavus]